MMAPNDHNWPADTDFPDLADVTVIAQGAHATVYRAYQISAGREVALKVDNRILGPGKEQQRFEQEVRAVGQLSEHPGIIDTFVAGFTGAGRPYVVTELCRGSYADRMAETGVLPPEEVKRIGIRVADALAVAHQHRVLHRDIKPANLLIDRNNEPVLADFGVASLMDSRTEEPVVRAAMTPAYAPLETFHLRPSGEPGDVYSLAATLYALLSGRPPRFPADDREFTIEDVMALFGEPIADIAGVSQVLLGMLRAAMTNNPAGRPSALQFRDMLESVPMASATGMIPTVRPQSEPEPVVPQQPQPMPNRVPVGRGAGTTERRSPANRPSPRPRPNNGPARANGYPPPPSPPPREFNAEFAAPPPEEDSADRLPVLAPSRDLVTRRERRIAQRGGKEGGSIAPLLLVGSIAVTIIIAATVGIFLFLTSGGEPLETSPQDSEAKQSCSLEEFDLSCMEEPLCFDGDLVDGSGMASAKSVSCKSEHAWEAYGKGELPADIDDPSYDTVADSTVVQESCFNRSDSNPLLNLKGIAESDWSSDVLPPTEKEFKAGNLEFHCVASRKDGEPSSKSDFVGS